MAIDLNELKEKKKEIVANLKDFQCATVERVDHLFCAGRNRVLVADEVGLGKTLIARGTIINQAIHSNKAGNKIFKVVYICSNQSIANQNISKLDLFNSYDDYASDSRLSMQHLAMRESLERNKDKFIQLVPLTPDTSFRIGSNRATKGTAKERALIYVILKRIVRFNAYNDELKQMLRGNVRNFDSYIESYTERVERCEYNTNGEYPKLFIDDLVNTDDGTLGVLEKHLEEMRNNTPFSNSDTSVINSLRVLFAGVSIGGFSPDLVIMDEFQRFSYMTNPEKGDVETNKLVELFFNKTNTNILLLSATPYKLYSTLDELDEENGEEDHYSEFKSAVKFLINDKYRYSSFEMIWESYSNELREYANGESAVIEIRQKAEDALYDCIARTERISVMDAGDFIDDSSVKTALGICREDIISYLDIKEIVDSTNANEHRLVDYVKSCPYLMSYMTGYKIKKDIDTYYRKNPSCITELDKETLWVNYDDVNTYSDLLTTNARLSKLKEVALGNGSEKYLWVPPSMPYYKLQGVYENSGLFSKLLVFSSWEMVPRMIGTYISYEVEKATLAQVAQKNKKSITYTNTNRYLANKFNFERMSTLAMLYPSQTLANVYKPYKYANSGKSLSEILKDVERKLLTKVETLKVFENADSDANRAMWYYLAPALLDLMDDDLDCYLLPTFDKKYAYNSVANKFNKYLENNEDLKLGKMPDDLVKVLAQLAVGSLGVCSYRATGKNFYCAVKIALEMVYYLNTPESAAAISLAYSEEDDDKHWKNILRYCVDGCLQAVLDEYYHIVSDGVQASTSDDITSKTSDVMIKAFEYQTGSYRVNVNPIRKNELGKDYINMRAHYAVGFRKTSMAGSDDEVVRKDSIRNAFNSPFKPFVLATTSIGQEGLDFHQYCRKIMHWNLPSNPIDLEQREGRINRYKCLAIRQNIASRFRTCELRKNLWEDLFNKAVVEFRKPGQSEMVPYWCLGEKQEIKIERIIPMYPISKDNSNYERLIQILSLYRLTLGQSRQEELLEHFLKHRESDSNIRTQFIDLSPYSRVDENWKNEFMMNRNDSSQDDKDYETLKEFEHKKAIIEEDILNLEIQLEEIPRLPIGTVMVDKLGECCNLISYDEVSDQCSVEYDDGRKKTFIISAAVGKTLIINDVGYRKAHDEKTRIITALKKKYGELNQINSVISQLE